MFLKVQDLPLFDRPRERLLSFGSESLSVQELLSIVISSGIHNRSVLKITQELLTRFSSLKGLSQASITEISSIPGIGKTRAIQIKAILELGNRMVSEISQPGSDEIIDNKKAYSLVSTYLKNKRKEHFMLFSLDTRNRLIHYPETVSIGTLNASLVHPREIFSSAISNSAASVLVAHNHPSGVPSPSPADLEVTSQIVRAGNIIGIPLVDHIVIGEGKYCSIRETYPETFKTESVSWS